MKSKINLPVEITRSDYSLLKSDSNNWIGPLAEICSRHSIPPILRPIEEGSNLVATANEEFIIKVFPPFLRFQWESERLTLKQLSKKLSISTPELIYEGVKDGWPYLIMTKLEGASLKAVWPTLLEEQKINVLRQIGSLIAEVHRVDATPLLDLDPKWDKLIINQCNQAVTRHEKLGLSKKLLNGIESYLNENYHLIPQEFKPVILTGEYTPENILVKRSGSEVLIEGLIDFGDAMIGFNEYDLLGPGSFLAAGNAGRLNSLLHGYGLKEKDLNHELQKRLTTLLILHRYSNLPIQICIENWENRISTLNELEMMVWKFN